MTPEQYLKAAQKAFESGDYAKATAGATIASALAELARADAADHRPIYPGDHRPQQFEWCGTCRSNSRRVDEAGRDCPRCNIAAMRAVPCRFCGDYLEVREVDRGRRWVDARDGLGCPNAPDPNAPEPAPKFEPDPAGDGYWATLLGAWHTRGRDQAPMTARQVSEALDLIPHIPRTRFGERPHPVLLETWLSDRSGREHCGFRLVRAGEEPAAWCVEQVAD